ncbi:MAG TPA: asparagine synthase-related protein [Hyphomicrobium sp.]|nr:asparagine synthase-related protein [Hyphomicrobium sp.]
MSGIAGIVHFHGKPADCGLVSAMTHAMRYRGPDGINHWCSGCAALGSGLLQTTPQSLHERQPLVNAEESLVLVMDGRVDNREELGSKLRDRGVWLRTQADSELVLRAFETWGENCLAHIDGDFAFAVWDTRRRELFCARDRAGLKPFYYHWDGATFAFASDIHPLLMLPWIAQLPNEGMIAEICADEWCTRNETIWKDIMRLDAAHALRVRAQGPISRRYWLPRPTPGIRYRRDEDYIAHYRSLFLEIVRRHARCHTPVFCEVSGGLDSSAVFGAAEHLRRTGRLPAPALEGYTLAFAHDPAADEVCYARLVADHWGVVIHEIAPSLKDLDWFQEQADRYRTFPGYPNGVFGDGLYALAAAGGRRVCLTGIGGDHLLNGSPLHYADDVAAFAVDALLVSLKADAKAAGWLNALRNILRFGLYPQLPEKLRARIRSALIRPADRARQERRWLSADYRRLVSERAARRSALQTPHFETTAQRTLFQTLSYPFDSFARDLGERLGATNGIEFRHPFLAREFIEFAFATPGRLRLRGGQHKHIHVRALEGLLPPGIAERRTKANFAASYTAPLEQAWRKHLRDIAAGQRCRFDQDGLKMLYNLFIDSPKAGWQNWALWGVTGCQMALRATSRGRSSPQ